MVGRAGRPGFGPVRGRVRGGDSKVLHENEVHENEVHEKCA